MLTYRGVQELLKVSCRLGQKFEKLLLSSMCIIQCLGFILGSKTESWMHSNWTV